MSTDLSKIKQTLINISNGKGLLDTLIEFERTLDNAEVFAYQNWILGEIVEGPDIGRYFYKITLMYPFKKMPDPMGGLRLLKLGAKVSYSKAIFKKPTRVLGPKDWDNIQTKKAKEIKHKVWLVTIDLPIKYINRGIEQSDDIMLKDIDKTNEEIADDYNEDIMPEENELNQEKPDLTPDEDNA